MLTSQSLTVFLSANSPAICAELTAVRGSSPRERGAFMLVGSAATLGTIGGGALEYMVIARARQALRDGLPADSLDVPLGPEIGQCCGGRVEVSLRVVDPALAARLRANVEAEVAARPHVFLFGAGHVGQALARALLPLPLNLHVVDTRSDELRDLPAEVDAQALPLPEAAVRAAPKGSAYVILTHDHALDFLIAAEALKRADSPYVGMVGSRTKRAKFRGWYLEQGGDEAALRRLILPIGASPLRDKRPEVIAALAAAEILVHIGRWEASDQAWPESNLRLGAAVD